MDSRGLTWSARYRSLSRFPDAMFGYIRPDAPELKVKEFERFRACYCGLCHELGKEYGVAGRFILNYDFVFLAMLLWHEDEPSEYGFKRCVPALCRKRCVCQSSRPLTVSAGYSVILTYWKLNDTIVDSWGLKKLIARIMRMLLKRAYRKAASDYSAFDTSVREYLTALTALEQERVASLDRPADQFACLLASAAEQELNAGARRALEQLLYHVGRIIYIADAYNDLRDDWKSGNYNPVAERFALRSADAGKDVAEAVLSTLLSSQAMAAAAYELLPRNYWTPITENIIYSGIPAMCRGVINGTYNANLKRLPKRPKNALGRMESRT